MKSKVVFMVWYVSIIPNWSISLVLPKYLWEKCINVLLYGKHLYICSGTMLLVRSLVVCKAPLWKWQPRSSAIHLTIKQWFFSSLAHPNCEKKFARKKSSCMGNLGYDYLQSEEKKNCNLRRNSDSKCKQETIDITYHLQHVKLVVTKIVW